MSISVGSQDHDDLRKAVALLESPTITSRVSALIGSPVESLVRRLPDAVSAQINKAIEVALHKAAGTALSSLANTPHRAASTRLHKWYAAGVGAIGGAFGLAAQLVELPVSTTVMLRAVADVARSEGFDLDDLATRQACIEVFALGTASDKDDAVDTGYYLTRTFTAEAMRHLSRELVGIAAKQGAQAAPATSAAQLAHWLAMLIERVAERFGVVISSKLVAQSVPIIGAATGATINTLFISYYQDVARGHFTILRLERKYGHDEVKRAYQQVLRGS